MTTRTSTIRIRQTRGGTTIRATGSAAKALFDAITASAMQAQKAVEQPTEPQPELLQLSAKFINGENL